MRVIGFLLYFMFVYVCTLFTLSISVIDFFSEKKLLVQTNDKLINAVSKHSLTHKNRHFKQTIIIFSITFSDYLMEIEIPERKDNM